MPVLSTSRYTEPSVFLGEVINPEAANLSADARIPAIVAKGDRLAIARNQGIRRAFILSEQLSFSPSPPYMAPLAFEAKGEVGNPNRLFKQDGTEVRADKWRYVLTGNQYLSVQIEDDSFDPTATYYADYQSVSRLVRDQMPIQQIRELRAVGNQLDRSQYIEYRDYYIPTDFVAPVADIDNSNVLADFSAIIATPQGGSTGTLAYASANEYTHAYNRDYKLICTSVSGSTPNRIANFTWEASLASPGALAAAPVPLHSLDAKPVLVIDEADALSLTQELEYGISLDFDFGGTNYVAGDEFIFSAYAPALIEIDPRYANEQFAVISAPMVTEGAANNMQILVSANAAYSLLRNNKYSLKKIGETGSAPNRQFTFVWSRYGESPVAANSFVVAENNTTTHSQLLANGVQFDFVIGTVSPANGTVWVVSATAPRVYYAGKDSREYTMTIGAVTSPAVNVTQITGSFTTNTTEGKFGSFTASLNSATGAGEGYAILPDQVSLAFRNMNRFVSSDVFTAASMVREEIDWTLNQKVEDVREVTSFLTDLNGEITGTAGYKYVILRNIPTDNSSLRVQDAMTGNDLSFNFRIGTPFIFFSIDPGVAIRISYTTRGQEPDPGQLYYVTAAFLRPDTAYNAPFLALRLEDGKNFAAPSTNQNDLHIGNEIAWANGAQAVYLVQPKNLDGSGNYTVVDFQLASRSLRSFDRITDVCLLNFNDGLADVLSENLIACDPFEKRAHLVWVGLPIGTPLGDDNTEGSQVYTAKRTLQVRGDSAAKGTRIQVGNTRATKTILLDSGVTTTVTLDGSFLALAMASRVASFADPATDVLRTQVAGFDTIDIMRDEENKILGAAQINYIKGSPGAYFWGEDVTVDTTKNFDRIQLMTQRQFVTKVVVREMDSLIGITPVSTEGGRNLVRGRLASILRGLLGRGLIGQYLDENQNERQFDPEADIVVYADKNDPSLYYFNFAWFSRNVIKRLFGLYQLNSNDFSVGVPLT